LLTQEPFNQHQSARQLPKTIETILASESGDAKWQCLYWLDDVTTTYGSSMDGAIAAAANMLSKYTTLDGDLQSRLSELICVGQPRIRDAFVGTLTEMLNDSDYRVRFAALEAIDCRSHDAGTERLKPMVRERLNDDHFLVRHAASVVFDMMNSPESYDSESSP
jgi:hypothetical protein